MFCGSKTTARSQTRSKPTRSRIGRDMAPARIAKAWRAAFHRLVPARLDQSAVGALAARSSKGRGTSEEEPELAGVCRGRGYGGLVHRGQKAEIVVVLAVGGKPRRRDLRKRGTLAFVDTETGSRDLVRQDTVLERLDGSNEHGIRFADCGRLGQRDRRRNGLERRPVGRRSAPGITTTALPDPTRARALHARDVSARPSRRRRAPPPSASLRPAP